MKKVPSTQSARPLPSPGVLAAQLLKKPNYILELFRALGAGIKGSAPKEKDGKKLTENQIIEIESAEDGYQLLDSATQTFEISFRLRAERNKKP